MKSWFFSVFSTEFRKIFSYRVDFWIQFLGSVAGEIAIAYFLWQALYSLNNTTTINGYSFSTMILYYVFAAFAGRIIRGNDAFYVSTEIYEGGLNRFLLYPINFFAYSFAQRLAYLVLTVIQMLLGLFVLHLIFKTPSEFHFKAINFIAGTIYATVGCGIYFLIGMVFELVAFWADNVWSLTVMFRFICQFLSGIYLPLMMFPQATQKILYFTPFPYLGSEPIKMFLGQITILEGLKGILILATWGIPLSFLLKFIWSRGTRQYTGVGI